MPFTLAHPVVVLPLARQRLLPFSALIIGSMVPDFSHVLILSWRNYGLAHSYHGLITLDLPVAIGVYVVFHAFLKLPLLSLLPARDAEALYPLAAKRQPINVGTILATIAALFLGALSHIVLDDFTHGYGWFVLHIAPLRAHIPWIGPPVFKLLQYSISVLGCLVLAVYYRRWRAAQPRLERSDMHSLSPIPPRRKVVKTASWTMGLTLIYAIAHSVATHTGFRHNLAPRRVVSDIICTLMAAAAMAICFYAAYWHRERYKSRHSRASDR